MNKTELIASMAEISGVSKKDTEQVLNAFTAAVEKALKCDGKVQLPGFGTFEVPAFKPGKALKDAIQ